MHFAAMDPSCTCSRCQHCRSSPVRTCVRTWARTYNELIKRSPPSDRAMRYLQRATKMKGCKYARDCLERVVADHRTRVNMYLDNPREFWLSEEDALFGDVIFSVKRDLPGVGVRRFRIYELSGNYVIRADELDGGQKGDGEDGEDKHRHRKISVAPLFLTKFDVEAFASYAGWPEKTATNASTQKLASRIVDSVTAQVDVRKVCSAVGRERLTFVNAFCSLAPSSSPRSHISPSPSQAIRGCR